MTVATRRNAGFTLIELLIVVGILGLLSAILLPSIFDNVQGAKHTTTATLLKAQLGNVLNDFYNSHGYYPPDDLKPVEAETKANWKADNGRNTGIESLVCFLQHSKYDQQLRDVTRTNTDGDQHGAKLKLFDTTERVELADVWGTPIAYFNKPGVSKGQMMVLAPDTDAVKVMPKRSETTNEVLGKATFQLLSAGGDLTFGTADDIAWPDN